MIENLQVVKLQRHLRHGMSLSQAALKSGMSEKTARKYRDSKKLPSELSPERTWRTRKDPFENVWVYVHAWLNANPRLTTTEIFHRLQRDYPKLFSGSLRTLQRGVNEWRKSTQTPVQSCESVSRQWMNDVLQGKMSVERLQSELCYAAPVALLDTVIRNGQMAKRKKALTILASVKGIPNAVIARFLHIGQKTTRGYRDLFEKAGLDGLFSRKRNRVCKSDDARYVEPVLATLHAPPSTYGINRTTWKQDDLQRVLGEQGIGISIRNIRAILKKAGYRWRKAKRVLMSTDPAYKEKLATITSILSTIRPTERFFSIDEFGPFHITKKPGRKLVRPDEDHTVPQHQRSRGRLIVTAALELCTNQVTHFYSDRKNTGEMIRLVDVLTEEYAGFETLYFSWDAASWHMSRRFYAEIARINVNSALDNGLPRIELVPLPACAQFLNVIESIFSGMARAIIHNSDYASAEEAKKAIDRYFADRNNWFQRNPKRAGN
jgi:transposase